MMTPLDEACQSYLAHIEARHYAASTIENYRGRLLRFRTWTRQLGFCEPKEITRKVLLAYQRYLFRFKRTNGRPLSASVQGNHLQALRMFFSWLTKEGEIDANPAADLELPKKPRRLPRDVLTREEAERIIAACDLGEEQGLRDRAILEVFYATGLRRNEVATLDIFDIQANRCRLFVREGKGKKDRVVPISARAVSWAERYMRESRPRFVVGDERTLFLTSRGKPISASNMTHIVKSYVVKSGVAKSGACHLFRHTTATLMLENGADVRFVQEMLGHAQLSTTQIYTRVSIHKLQEIYNATHPSSKTGEP